MTNQETIDGYIPHDNQMVIHEGINNRPQKYHVCNIGRQFGKTLLAINQALYWLLNDDNDIHIGWVSPIYKQCKKVFQDLQKATIDTGIFKYNESDLEIKYGSSKLSFYSGERPDNIRGNTFDYLIMDETAFQRANLWNEVLQPATLVKGKKVVFISTPNGKNHFYTLSNMINYSEDWCYYHFTSYDNPFISDSDLQSIKMQIPEYVFKQEYMAEFIDNVSGVFSNFHNCIGNPKDKGLEKYGGLDIGRADDYTVLTIIDKEGKQIFSKRWRHDKWQNIVSDVAKEINKYKCYTFVEVNNQGDVFYELLEPLCRRFIFPFVTTSKTKPILIENLAVSFENEELELKDIDYQNAELEAFTYVYDNRTRNVKYSAPQGMHDDSVISLALANQSRKENKTKGTYRIMRV